MLPSLSGLLGLEQSSGHHGLGGGEYPWNGGNTYLRTTKIPKLRRNSTGGVLWCTQNYRSYLLYLFFDITPPGTAHHMMMAITTIFSPSLSSSDQTCKKFKAPFCFCNSSLLLLSSGLSPTPSFLQIIFHSYGGNDSISSCRPAFLIVCHRPCYWWERNPDYGITAHLAKARGWSKRWWACLSSPDLAASQRVMAWRSKYVDATYYVKILRNPR